jgi:hypothetical protein
MGVARFSRLLRGVGVLAIPAARLDTTQCFESVCKVPAGASVLRQLETSGVVRVFVERRGVPAGVDATC